MKCYHSLGAGNLFCDMQKRPFALKSDFFLLIDVNELSNYECYSKVKRQVHTSIIMALFYDVAWSAITVNISANELFFFFIISWKYLQGKNSGLVLMLMKTLLIVVKNIVKQKNLGSTVTFNVVNNYQQRGQSSIVQVCACVQLQCRRGCTVFFSLHGHKFKEKVS